MDAVHTGTHGPVRIQDRLQGRLGTLVVVVGLAIGIAALAFVVNQPSADSRVFVAAGGAPPRVGEAPPDFQAVTVDGTPVRLSDFAGQPVWLTFGASWCADCRAEATDLQATYARNKDKGLVVLGVFVEEDAQAVKAYADRVGFTFTMAPDPQRIVADRYHLLGLPTHLFIGRDGRIQEVRLGGLQPDDMERLVQRLTE